MQKVKPCRFILSEPLPPPQPAGDVVYIHRTPHAPAALALHAPPRPHIRVLGGGRTPA